MMFAVTSCENNSENTKTDSIDYSSLGHHIAKTTQKELGMNLKAAINSKGISEAVSFCNLRAMPIIDSMEGVHNAKIKRITDKPRNQQNLANEKEKEIISSYQQSLNNDIELKPILNETGNLATFYMPIITNQMCMNCHGKKDMIDPNTKENINNLYPSDMATGYTPEQVRGIWKIEIEK